MQPDEWLRWIVDAVARYRRGDPHALRQLAYRLSRLDGDADDETPDPAPPAPGDEPPARR